MNDRVEFESLKRGQTNEFKSSCPDGVYVCMPDLRPRIDDVVHRERGGSISEDHAGVI